MLEQIEANRQENNLYMGSRLTEAGKIVYPDLLIEAVKSGDIQNFAKSLSGLMISKETTSVCIAKTVPYNASMTLARGEFNKYYIYAQCQIGIKKGETQLRVYRAMAVNNQRGRYKEGYLISINDIWDHFQKKEPGTIFGPNSGLSVEQVK